MQRPAPLQRPQPHQQQTSMASRRLISSSSRGSSSGRCRRRGERGAAAPQPHVRCRATPHEQSSSAPPPGALIIEADGALCDLHMDGHREAFCW